MTKKDYIRIAAAFSRARQNIQFAPAYSGALECYKAIDEAAACVAAALADDNSKFDRARFMAACGVAK